MAVWTVIKTCFAYLSYVALVLWMLFKEYLGYEVDWSRCPPLTPPQKEELDAIESQRIILRASSADASEVYSKFRATTRDNLDRAGPSLLVTGKDSTWKETALADKTNKGNSVIL